jgi:hypothetical protein
MGIKYHLGKINVLNAISLGFYLSHTCFCFLLHLLYISAYSLHLCPGGATSKITRWSVLLPCNSQIKSNVAAIAIAAYRPISIL